MLAPGLPGVLRCFASTGALPGNPPGGINGRTQGWHPQAPHCAGPGACVAACCAGPPGHSGAPRRNLFNKPSGAPGAATCGEQLGYHGHIPFFGIANQL